MECRVSLIASVFFPKVGGTPTQNHEIARNLRREGVDIRVYPTRAGQGFDYKALPYEVRIKNLSGDVSSKRYSFYSDSMKIFPRLLFELARDRHIRSSRIVHCDGPTLSGMLGCALKVLFRKRLVLNLGGNIYKEAKRRGFLKGFMSLAVASVVFRLADRIVPDGEDLAEELRRHGIPEGKIFTITNGIDIDLFSPKTKPEAFLDVLKERGIRIDEKKRVVVFLGLLVYENGPKEFVDVVRGLGRGVQGLVVGDGPMFEDVKGYIKSEGADVKMVGAIPRETDPSAFKTADVCVFPLVSIGGVSQIVPEAMSVGKAIVTTDTGSMSKLVKNGENGFLVKVHDVDKMAKCAADVLRNTALRRKIEKNARNHIVKNWSWDRVVKRYLELYSGLKRAK